MEPVDWSEAMTLEQYVISLFEEQMTDSKEFKAIVTVFGREKLVGIWEKYRAAQKESERFK